MGDLVKLCRPVSPTQDGARLQLSQQRNVIVLAQNFKLTPAQFVLLNKGLSFIPTVGIYHNQKIQTQLDIQNYHRRIKLLAFFKNTLKKVKIPFVKPSDWTPQLDELPQEVRDLIQKDLITFETHYKFIPEKLNISLQEIEALNELKNNKNIVIKPADKGSAVVILGREQYIMEVERQLNDTTYYKKISKPIYLDTIPLVNKILDKLLNKKFINSKQRRYLGGDQQPRERRFYILPKIHKDPEFWTIPHLVPPGRPIVSDCGSETYWTAEYLDYHLNPLSTRHFSFIKDTYDFIKTVLNFKMNSDFYFFTMDVNNLYTNIPIEAGIHCIKKIFEKYPDPKRPDEELIELLRINLTRNDFVFNQNYYLQIKGTAMGKKFAPAYANIFMADWEEQALSKCRIKPKIYLRYLDDIWGIWVGSLEEFKEFGDTLNNHDPSIKLKIQLEKDSINFLDTTVFKGPDFEKSQRLDIKVYFKDTDTHALLQFDSFHPKHTFRGILKSQLLRFKRICTRNEDFLEAVKILFKALRKRGYSRPFLRSIYKKFHSKQENKQIKEEFNLIPFVSNFFSITKLIHRKFKNNFEGMSHLEGLIPTSRIISAYRRNQNLKDWLVRAKMPSYDWKKPLRYQGLFTNLKYVINKSNGMIFRIQQRFSLRSSNMVYLIFCTKCHLKYVGETKNHLFTRLSHHLSNIRNKKEKDTLLVKHFMEHGVNSLRIAGMEGNSSWTDRDRKRRERFWIFSVGTRGPGGLNLKTN